MAIIKVLKIDRSMIRSNLTTVLGNRLNIVNNIQDDTINLYFSECVADYQSFKSPKLKQNVYVFRDFKNSTTRRYCFYCISFQSLLLLTCRLFDVNNKHKLLYLPIVPLGLLEKGARI